MERWPFDPVTSIRPVKISRIEDGALHTKSATHSRHYSIPQLLEMVQNAGVPIDGMSGQLKDVPVSLDANVVMAWRKKR